ncbi:MAG TPA: phosphoadenosine phosphosulfate reductase family protein [Romboutsia timonensis]|uniref:Phosphoadenosine phosphosulfate reductase family protein n=1 Tax=Romboutsia timonensis TaxID=1776391 RepID=A0A921N256_9FIRM|nr:phosphoadenosine phosphosulfate reductase family protein [Romboutsia timonensis]
MTFKVDLINYQINIKKYEKPIHKNYTLEEEYEVAREQLEAKVKQSIQMTKEYTLKNLDKKIFVSISGGKDSDVMKHIVDIAFNELREEGINVDYNLIAFNTSNDTAETYKHLKQHHKMTKENIISPEVGFYQWIVDKKNYFTPTRFVRNCCSTYKEGQLTKIMGKKEDTLTFLGMRSPESVKRKDYDFDLNEAQKKIGKKPNVPENWLRFLPIVKWTDAEVWLYILNRKMKYNDMYNKGFNRIGCFICPYQSDVVELLIKNHYPKQWKRWVDILAKGYEIYGVERRLKWDLLEWCEGGRWKSATSKESELTTKKATTERVKELAELKGISEEMAVKYFKKECSCGKKLNPTEIAMFLKLTGIYENQEDNRQYLCKKCLSEFLGITTKEYKEKAIEFIQGGCELF